MTNFDTIPGPDWIGPFLTALKASPNVREAALAAGIAPTTAYWQRSRNELFAQAWLDCVPGATLRINRHRSPARASKRLGGGWRAGFLEALAETSNITLAAARANVPKQTVYRVRRQDPVFAAHWRAALFEGYDNLEMELLGYLRDPAPERKLDVAAALRLLAAHRETVARERALHEDDDEQAILESIDRFIDEMRQRRAANAGLIPDRTGDAQ
ncbi:MAG: hypothetical protein ACO1OD_00190 [Croceibacterium sp.]